MDLDSLLNKIELCKREKNKKIKSELALEIADALLEAERVEELYVWAMSFLFTNETNKKLRTMLPVILPRADFRLERKGRTYFKTDDTIPEKFVAARDYYLDGIQQLVDARAFQDESKLDAPYFISSAITKLLLSLDPSERTPSQIRIISWIVIDYAEVRLFNWKIKLSPSLKEDDLALIELAKKEREEEQRLLAIDRHIKSEAYLAKLHELRELGIDPSAEAILLQLGGQELLQTARASFAVHRQLPDHPQFDFLRDEVIFTDTQFTLRSGKEGLNPIAGLEKVGVQYHVQGKMQDRGTTAKSGALLHFRYLTGEVISVYHYFNYGETVAPEKREEFVRKVNRLPVRVEWLNDIRDIDDARTQYVRSYSVGFGAIF